MGKENMKDKDYSSFANLGNELSHIRLTKREYFAAMAMQGLLQNEDYATNETTRESLAKDSVLMADALLNELNK